MRNYASVNFSDVTIKGGFWGERLDTVLGHTIPSQHKQLEENGILESLKLLKPAPPLRIPRNKTGFTTQIFWDSDVGKWIEAASYAISHQRDDEIEAQIEAITDDLQAAQAEDGYLNCWYLQHEPENRWTNLRDNHELYNCGHLLEGAVAYFQATGRRRLMDIMIRYVDHIAATFGAGEGQKRGYPGHQEIELALVKLWHATGERRFLDLATYFIDERGRQPHFYDKERDARGEAPGAYGQGTYEYNQSHLPVREQTKVVGHAVRAMYMYAAMADLAAEHGDESLKRACETLWRDITETRMYVTGGFGPSARNEGFTADYDLPNDTAYAETCASVAMVFWAQRMLNLDLDGQYADIMEQALYNNSLAGLSCDGEHYFYDNKLDSDGSHERWAWHHCPCCTMNVARLVASVAGYFYSTGKDEIAVHLYGGAEAMLEVAGTTVRLREQSDYPWSGEVKLTLDPEQEAEFALSLRVPGWAGAASVMINGENVDTDPGKGYLKLRRKWRAGDKVELSLPMPPRRIYAHPDVRADIGRVALARGPLIYCAEQADNGDIPVHRMRLPRDAEIAAEDRDNLLGGITVLMGQARTIEDDFGRALYRSEPPRERDAVITAVPYYIWCNRGPNAMQVWIRE